MSSKKMQIKLNRQEQERKNSFDTVYLNTLGNTEFITSNGVPSRQKAYHIRKVLDSNIPITSRFKELALIEAGKVRRTDDRDELETKINSATIDDVSYKTYAPSARIRKIANVLKRPIATDVAALEITKEADSLELAHIKEEIKEEEEDELTGMRSSPKTVFVPIVEDPTFKSLGKYQTILNDIMAGNKYTPSEIKGFYDTFVSEDSVEKFVSDKGGHAPYALFKLKKLVPEKDPSGPLEIPLSPSISPTTAPLSRPPSPTGMGTLFTTPTSTPAPTPPSSPVIGPIASPIPMTSLTSLPSGPIVPPSTQNQQQQQPLLKTSGENIILNNVRADRFHPVEIEWFFGSRDIPEWDKTLEQQVLSSHLTKEEIISKMSMILRSTGDKMGIDDHKGHTLEELNELQQLHFCVIRALQRGSRYKTANVKLNDLQSLMAAVDPEKQSSDLAKIITQPPTTSNPVVLSVPEAEAKFQKAINTSKYDLSGRDISSIGNINTTKLVYSGNFDEKGLRPNNITISSRPRNKKY